MKTQCGTLLAGWLAFSVASASGPPAADETTAESAGGIDEIVVVAHKHPRSIRDVAATVSVFSNETMRLELGSTVADIFRYAPGIDVESDGTRFGSESINVRGISGNRVAVLIDGVPLSDQYDVGSFSNATRSFLDAGLIDSVEVLRGPASALYGSAAIGGVVAMRTPEPRTLAGSRGRGGRASVNFREDNASVQATAMQALTGGRMSVLVGGSYQQSGESSPAAVRETLDRRHADARTGLLKLVVDDAFGNSWRAGFAYQQNDVRSALRSMLGHGRFQSTTALEGQDAYRSRLMNLEYRFGDSVAVDDGTLRAYVQRADIDQYTYDERGAARRPVAIDRQFYFGQETLGLETNLQKLFWFGDVSHQVGFGIEYRERRTEEFRDGLEVDLADGAQSNTLLGEVFPLRDFPISKTSDWGAYLEDTLTFNRWSVVGALRADQYNMRPVVDAMYLEDYPFASPVDITESELSPKLGLIFRPTAATELWLQYAHGFRAPPYEDANVSLEVPLFNYRAIPNPDLKPERSDSVDLGLRWRGQAGSADLSVFRSEYDDFVESRVRLGPDPESGRILFQARNIDRAVIEGVEAGASLALENDRHRIDMDARLYWARGEDRNSHEALNSVGPPQAVVSVGWTTGDERWLARLRGTFTDDWSERDESGGELFKAPGYGVIDLFIARRFDSQLVLRAGLLNVLDRSYWSWTDIRGLAPDDPILPYLSRPGRSYTLGVDLNW